MDARPKICMRENEFEVKDGLSGMNYLIPYLRSMLDEFSSLAKKVYVLLS
jgi:hypothetical protein